MNLRQTGFGSTWISYRNLPTTAHVLLLDTRSTVALPGVRSCR